MNHDVNESCSAVLRRVCRGSALVSALVPNGTKTKTQNRIKVALLRTGDPGYVALRRPHVVTPGERGSLGEVRGLAGSTQPRLKYARRTYVVTPGDPTAAAKYVALPRARGVALRRGCREEVRDHARSNLARSTRPPVLRHRARGNGGARGLTRSTRRRPEDAAGGRRGDAVGRRAIRPCCQFCPAVARDVASSAHRRARSATEYGWFSRCRRVL